MHKAWGGSRSIDICEKLGIKVDRGKYLLNLHRDTEKSVDKSGIVDQFRRLIETDSQGHAKEMPSPQQPNEPVACRKSLINSGPRSTTIVKVGPSSLARSPPQNRDLHLGSGNPQIPPATKHVSSLIKRKLPTRPHYAQSAATSPLILEKSKINGQSIPSRARSRTSDGVSTPLARPKSQALSGTSPSSPTFPSTKRARRGRSPVSVRRLTATASSKQGQFPARSGSSSPRSRPSRSPNWSPNSGTSVISQSTSPVIAPNDSRQSHPFGLSDDGEESPSSSVLLHEYSQGEVESYFDAAYADHTDNDSGQATPKLRIPNHSNSLATEEESHNFRLKKLPQTHEDGPPKFHDFAEELEKRQRLHETR